MLRKQPIFQGFNICSKQFTLKGILLFLVIIFQVQYSHSRTTNELIKTYNIQSAESLNSFWEERYKDRENLYLKITVSEWISLFENFYKDNSLDKNPKLKFIYYYRYADLLHSSTRFEQAIPVLKKIIENRKYLPKKHYEMVYLKLEESYVAIGQLEEALKVREKRIDLGYETNYWSMYSEAGLYKQAIEEFKKHVALPKNNPWYEIFYHLDLGTLYFKNDQLDEALSSFKKGHLAADKICKMNNYPEKSDYSEYTKYYYRTLMNGNCAQVYLRKKQFKKAIPLLIADVENSKSIQEISNAILKRLDLADCYLQLNENNKVKNYLDTVSQLIKTNKMYFYEFKYFDIKAKYFNQVKQFDSASFYMNKYIDAKEIINKRNREFNIIGLIQYFNTEKKQAQIIKQKLALADQKLKVSEERRNRNLLFAAAIIFAILSLGLWIYSRQKSKRKLEIEKSLEEKEILLKEIHHRVKNNLTTLKSLLFLQGRASSNDEVKRILSECEMRIQSMALIHQNLYQESIDGRIAIKDFFYEMFENLNGSFNKENYPVDVELSMDDFYMEMSQGLFLGLIINELATNSYKYAFQKDGNGQIKLKLELKDDQHIIKYQDNGPGLKGGFDSYQKGFGFKLIRILVSQVDGTIDYTSENGYSTFTIQFYVKSNF